MAMIKAWGFKHEIFSGNGVTVDLLRIFPGGFSSIHFHQHLHNYLYLLSGELDIEAYNYNIVPLEELAGNKRLELIDTMIISTSKRDISIEPMNIHCFRNKGDVNTEVIEVTYDPGIKTENDIKRLIIGGQSEPATPAKETINPNSSPFGLEKSAGEITS